eukprot:COSAG01_NODE_52821_length_343_cov_44.512295_1_plen_55_part_01
MTTRSVNFQINIAYISRSELVVQLYLLCAYLVVVPTAVHLPLEGLVVCIIYYLLL